MKFDENASIRYLMKEMDPSEEILFEKRMMEDEDLLIEVESLRNIHQRLSDLPDMNPPNELSRRILSQASDYHQKQQKAAYRTVYLSAAATIMVAFLAGAYLVFDPFDNVSDGATSSQSAEAGFAPFSTLENYPVLDLQSESEERLSPWVDQNEELHFLDRYSSEHAEAFDSLMQNSLERLQPRQTPGSRDRSEPSRELHLTGQPQN